MQTQGVLFEQMNSIKHVFESTLGWIDQYKREQQLNLARTALHDTLASARKDAEDKHELQTNPVFLEADALHSYMIGNPYTKLGLAFHERADTKLDKAVKHARNPDEAEALLLRQKTARAAVDRIMGFEE